jgi:hypothetical protein
MDTRTLGVDLNVSAIGRVALAWLLAQKPRVDPRPGRYPDWLEAKTNL